MIIYYQQVHVHVYSKLLILLETLSIRVHVLTCWMQPEHCDSLSHWPIHTYACMAAETLYMYRCINTVTEEILEPPTTEIGITWKFTQPV